MNEFDLFTSMERLKLEPSATPAARQLVEVSLPIGMTTMPPRLDAWQTNFGDSAKAARPSLAITPCASQTVSSGGDMLDHPITPWGPHWFTSRIGG